jgi:hypothetical protein
MENEILQVVRARYVGAPATRGVIDLIVVCEKKIIKRKKLDECLGRVIEKEEENFGCL